MKYTIEDSLRNFKAWGQGLDNLNYIIDLGIVDDVEAVIEDLFYDQDLTDTTINDLLWFDLEHLLESVGGPGFEFDAYAFDFNNLESNYALYCLVSEANKIDEFEGIVTDHFSDNYPNEDEIGNYLDDEYYNILEQLNIKPIDVTKCDLTDEAQKMVGFLAKFDLVDGLEECLIDYYWKTIPTTADIEEDFSDELIETACDIIETQGLEYK